MLKSKIHDTNEVTIGDWKITHEYDKLKFVYKNVEQATLHTEFDYIVVGGGPSGCGCARKLAQAGYHIALFERGSKTNLKASALNAEVEALTTTDGYQVLLGKGLGGGSNHNGMVYVDGPLVENIYPEFAAHFEEINNVIQPTELNGYTPEQKAQIEATIPTVVYNKHWSDTQPGADEYRFTSAKLIEAFTNIHLYTGTVKKAVISNSKCSGVELYNGEIINARQGVVLCAGAIHTPCILERSSLYFNTTLRDHLGVNLIVPLSESNQHLCKHYFETTQTSLYQVWEQNGNYQIYFTPIQYVGLVITFATSANVNNNGTVSYDSTTDKPVITMNYTSGTEDIESHLRMAFDFIADKLNITDVDFYDLYPSAYSIYHYNGSLASAVNDYKVNDIEHLYVGDLSALQQAPPCSTTVIAAATGMHAATTIPNSGS